ncbi:MAG: NAD(P)-dependent oxidoreductase, partial [Halovenus sp.]
MLENTPDSERSQSSRPLTCFHTPQHDDVHREQMLLRARRKPRCMPISTPGITVGVVGGGQLGRMLGEAAGPLGIELVVSDPTPDCPASPVVRDQIVGDFDDEQTLHELAERADIVTFEIELAGPDVLDAVSEETG